MRKAIALALLISFAVPAGLHAIEKKAFVMREDFGTEALQDSMYQCIMQYYYYVPCPTYGWFWGFYDWVPGEVIGKFFTIGEAPTGENFDQPCDPTECYRVSRASVLDFAGYGTLYPGLFTVEFDIYCSDSAGIPVGPSLWTSAPYETHFGWNDVVVDPPVSVVGCQPSLSFMCTYPRFLFTATHTGSDATYPQWAFDNVSAYVLDGCVLHLIECRPLLYPRPYSSYYTTMHSQYYGIDFAEIPPLWFLDGADTTDDGTVYGFLELAWKVMLECVVEEGTEATTWSGIKAMYR